MLFTAVSKPCSPWWSLLLAATSLGALATAPGCARGTDPDVADGGTESGTFVTLPDGDTGPACRADNDGVISRDEVVFAPGVEVRYRVNPAGTLATVDTAGSAASDGTRVWDFSNTAGELVALRLAAVTDQWFAARFDSAQYAARLDPRATLLGVYRATDTSLDLLGVAGEQASEGTELAYDAPIELLRFPLAVGASWTSQGMVLNGMVGGTPVASRDRYDVSVDAQGELRLGVITFRRAVRVRVESTQQFPAGMGVRRIQYLWLAECYGEVARATSRDGELDPNFTQATEFRRLGL